MLLRSRGSPNDNHIKKAFTKNLAVIRNIQLDTQNYNEAEKKILINQLINDMVGVSRGYLGKE